MPSTAWLCWLGVLCFGFGGHLLVEQEPVVMLQCVGGVRLHTCKGVILDMPA